MIKKILTIIFLLLQIASFAQSEKELTLIIRDDLNRPINDCNIIIGWTSGIDKEFKKVSNDFIIKLQKQDSIYCEVTHPKYYTHKLFFYSEKSKKIKISLKPITKISH